MCHRCKPNHPVDVAVSITGVGMVIGAGWTFAHAYEGQPFMEALVPWLFITAFSVVIGAFVGLVIWQWEALREEE